MGIFGGIGPIAGILRSPIELIIPEDAVPPSSMGSPQQSQLGAEQSWDTFREYWGAHAAAQNGFLAIMRDRFKGVG
jgi:hypothetical protein